MNKYKVTNEYSWQNMLDYCYIQNEKNDKIYFLRGLARDLWNAIFKDALSTEAIYRIKSLDEIVKNNKKKK